MNQYLPKHVMVFDVESIGLHGEGFAVGWVIIDDDRNEIETGCHACDPSRADGSRVDRAWVMEHIPEPQSGYNHRDPTRVRAAFWDAWLKAKAKYPDIVLAADCAWPVEANFLAMSVRDDFWDRQSQGPYPLHEIASFLSTAGIDPMKTHPRLANELPVHDPLADARQSSRLFGVARAIIRLSHSLTST